MTLMRKTYKFGALALALVMMAGLVPRAVPAVAAPTGGFGPNGNFLKEIGPVTVGSQPISNAAQLFAINDNTAGIYHLTGNITVTVSDWNMYNQIGLEGIFDGRGFTVTFDNNLSVFQGLFEVAENATIKNVGVHIGTQGNEAEGGGLVGWAYRTTISNCYVMGTAVNSPYAFGGLVSDANRTTISDSYAAVNITAVYNAGGLAVSFEEGMITNSYATGNVTSTSTSGNGAGGLIGEANEVNIYKCFATGNVTSNGDYAGGLIGYDGNSSTIANSYATGTVSGRCAVGGLIGMSEGSTVSNSFAMGSVTASGCSCIHAGGLIGTANGTVSNSYATGNITGSATGSSEVWIGGLIGYIEEGSITNCYATGNISFTAPSIAEVFIGGLTGLSTQTWTQFPSGNLITVSTPITNSYRLSTQTLNVTGGAVRTTDASGTPLTDAQMRQQSSFTGWNFDTVWDIGSGYPFLRADAAVDIPLIGTISLTDAPAPHINLAAETINLGNFDVAAWSIDGGNRWRRGALPTDRKWTNLFNKSMTLWVSDSWNNRAIKADAANGVAAAPKGVDIRTASIIKFPKTEARPRANAERVAPWYGTERDRTWGLSIRGKTFSEPKGTYEFAATSDGRTPDGNWARMPAGGLPIPEAGRVRWLFRTPALVEGTKYTPGSRAFRLQAVTFVKAPKYKAPKEKNGEAVLKLRQGDFAEATVNGELRTFGSFTARTDVKLGAATIPGGASVTIWKAATGRRPHSLPQEGLLMPALTPPG
jgi:hypothetical protein